MSSLSDIIGRAPFQACDALTVILTSEDLDGSPAKLTPDEQMLVNTPATRVPAAVREAKRRSMLAEKMRYNNKQLALHGMYSVEWHPSMKAILEEDNSKDVDEEREFFQREFARMDLENAKLMAAKERTIERAKWRYVVEELKRVLVHQHNVTLYIMDRAVDCVFDAEQPPEVRLRALPCVTHLKLFPSSARHYDVLHPRDFLPASLRTFSASSVTFAAPVLECTATASGLSLTKIT